ncbi:MAG: MBL fold metallo-hydrolase [Candidatus Aenigmatarchaeota archaeon]|nr:MBL fold metallo-hydrolase [Candidatus Aenigmarchaeota archaeon]
MIQISFHGAMAIVGCSSVVVDTGVEKIVLDYGTKIQEMPPLFPIPIQTKINAVLLSHAHLDHSGAVPILEAKKNSAPIYAPNVTKQLSELLWLDSIKISHEEKVELPFNKNDVRRTLNNFVVTDFRKPFTLKKTKVTLFDAGHIPGSVMPFLDTGEKTLLYTGDYKIASTRLMRGADTNLPDVDILITESTYCDREHPDRKSQEKELIKIINNTLANDGITLISGFAVGRIDELLLVLDHYGIDYPVYVDGMAKKALTIINQHKNLLKEPKSLDKALEKVEYVKNQGMRKRIIKNPGVILSTSGMLTGGPIVWYISKLFDKQNCSLVLSGFQVEGTPGKTLLETGRYINEGLDVEVDMFVKRLDFSSHLGRSELFQFINKLNPEKIFCVHGEHTEEFANELKEKGFDAVAPLANNRIFEL